MKRVPVISLVVAALVVRAACVDGGLADQYPVWRWVRGGPSPWPTIERSELTVLLEPGFLRLDTRLQLSGVTDVVVPLLLNRDLDVVDAQADGVDVDVGSGLGLDTRYHSEGRVVFVQLPAVPADGRVALDLHVSGATAHGDEGSDWRGILYLGDSEVRFSEQTNWIPQVPLAPDGPGKQRAPFELTVLAPAAWELFAPGTLTSVGAGPDDPLLRPARERIGGAFTPASLERLRCWVFRSERPVHLNLVGGLRERASVTVGDTRVLTLLRAEHAALGPPFVDLGAEVLSLFAESFGPAASGSLCVFEQTCRSKSSYNWAAESLVVFDRWALGDEVPVSQLAHEIGHLWWGQTWSFEGRGERFLTEGGAEASSWSFLDLSGRGGALRRELEAVRGHVAALVERGDSTALAAVGFGSDAYQTLAYEKGALVHRYVWGSLSPEARRAFFAGLGDGRDQPPLSLERWRAALAAADPALAVPWLEHDGDLSLRLDDVRYDGPSRTLHVQLTAAARGESPAFDARVRVQLRVSGRGFAHDVFLDLPAGTSSHAIDLSGVRPWRPADLADADALVGPHGEPRVLAVALDPEELLPLGVDGEATIVLDGPRLVASSPAQGERVALGLETLSLTFDRPLRPFDVATYEAQRPLVGGAERTPHLLDIQWSDDGRTATLRLRPLLPGTHWVLPLHGAFQGRWSDWPMPSALRFETLPSDDRTAPNVLRCDPPVGATDVPRELPYVVVTFDEPMQAGVGFDSAAVRGLQDAGFAHPSMDFGEWDPSGRVLSLPLREPLTPGVTYKLPIGRPLRDLSGNIAAPFEVVFTAAKN